MKAVFFILILVFLSVVLLKLLAPEVSIKHETKYGIDNVKELKFSFKEKHWSIFIIGKETRYLSINDSLVYELIHNKRIISIKTLGDSVVALDQMWGRGAPLLTR